MKYESNEKPRPVERALNEEDFKQKWNLLVSFTSQLDDTKNENNKGFLLESMKSFNQQKQSQLIQSVDFNKLSMGNIDLDQFFTNIQSIVDKDVLSHPELQELQVSSAKKSQKSEQNQQTQNDNDNITPVKTQRQSLSPYEKKQQFIERYDIGLDRSFNLNRKGHSKPGQYQNTDPSDNLSKAYSEPERIESNANQLFMLLSASQIKEKKPHQTPYQQHQNQNQIQIQQQSADNLSQINSNPGIQLTDAKRHSADYLKEPSKMAENSEYFDIQHTNNNNNNINNEPNFTKKKLLQLPEQKLVSKSTSSLQSSPNQANGALFNKDPFREFTEKKLKELAEKEGLNKLIELRQQAIEFRMNAQVDLLDQLLREKTVSPRTYESKRIELQNWVDQEREDLEKEADQLEKGWTDTMDSINKTKRDMEFAQRFSNNPLTSSQVKFEYLQKSTHSQSQSQSDCDEHANQIQNLNFKNVSQKSAASNQIKIIDSFEPSCGTQEGEENDQKKLSQLVSTNSYDDALQNQLLNDQTDIQKQNKILHIGQSNSDVKLFLEPTDFQQLKSLEQSHESLTKEDLASSYQDYQTQNQNNNINIQDINPSNNSNNSNRYSNDSNNLKEDSSSSVNSSQKREHQSYNPNVQDEIISPQSFKNKESLSGGDSVEKSLNSNDKIQELQEEEQQQNSDQEDQEQQNVQEIDTQTLPQPQKVQDLIEDYMCHEQQQQPSQSQQDMQQMYQQQQSSYMEEIFMEMNEEMNERWRIITIIQQRLDEQMEKEFVFDKSENYGICTNLCVIHNYITSLFNYIMENHREEFFNNLSTPFGFSPNKRLKLIHGYDSFVETDSQQKLQYQLEDPSEYNTLPFVLSEELFIEFEQNVIGSGEDEKQQIIKEFEHIHNKSIFDSFNEALNMIRPYYAQGGPPYSWSKSEKIMIQCKKQFLDASINNIFKKSLDKILYWGSFLGGLVNEAEPIYDPEDQEKYSIKNIQFDPNRPLASLMEGLPPEHESFLAIKEEKLSKMLLTEIYQNEYKWCLYEDEKAEVIMELSDLVFEQLVENFVDEIHHIQQRQQSESQGNSPLNQYNELLNIEDQQYNNNNYDSNKFNSYN